MSSIFSTQNLQTFLRRKNLRPPPPSRGGPPGPRPPPPPPNRGRSPLGRSPLERGLSLGADCSGAFVSSAIVLLHLSAGFFTGWRESKDSCRNRFGRIAWDDAGLSRRRTFRCRNSRFRRRRR